MTRDDLEARFASRTVARSGGLLLLAPADTKGLIHEAESARIAILGIDGIFVRRDETVSPVEHIADFSDAYRRGEGSWRAAERFIDGHRGLDLVFEVTLGEHLDQRYNERCN